jgi:hypothetical protein
MFICGPDTALLSNTNLFEQFLIRLAWTDYPESEQDPYIENITTLDQAFQKYRDYTTDLNLREALRHVLRSMEPSWLTYLLAALGDYKTSVVTFDWDKRLDEYILCWAGAAHSTQRVLRLCGDLDRPGSVHWLDKFPLADKNDAHFWQEQTTFDKLYQKLKRSRLVFLGFQPFDHPGWREIFGSNLPKRDPRRGIWLVHDDDPPDPNDEIARRMTHIRSDPATFLHALLDRVAPDRAADPKHVPAPSPIYPEAEDYQPQVVDQELVIESILGSPARLWVLYAEPGAGKSAAMRKLVQYHQSRMVQAQKNKSSNFQTIERTPYGTIINFADDPALTRSKRAILLLLFDRFECDLPDLLDQERYPNYPQIGPRNQDIADTKTYELLKQFVNWPEFLVPFGAYHEAEILICFDNLHRAEFEYTIKWLCQDFARVLRESGVRFKVVLASREIRDRQRRHLLGQQFAEKRLEQLIAQHAWAMLKDYAEHVSLIGVPPGPPTTHARAMLTATIDHPTTVEQAERYIDLSQHAHNALVALVREHAQQGFIHIPKWPFSQVDELKLQREVIFPAVWKPVEEALELQEHHEILREIYRDIFLCRRLRGELFEELIARYPQAARRGIQVIQVRKQLIDNGFLYPFSQREDPEWYEVSEDLHRITRAYCRSHEPQRYCEVSLVAFDHMAQRIPSCRVYPTFEILLFEAMYHYPAVLECSTGDDATLLSPVEQLEAWINGYFEKTGLNRREQIETLEVEQNGDMSGAGQGLNRREQIETLEGLLNAATYLLDDELIEFLRNWIRNLEQGDNHDEEI